MYICIYVYIYWCALSRTGTWRIAGEGQASRTPIPNARYHSKVWNVETRTRGHSSMSLTISKRRAFYAEEQNVIFRSSVFLENWQLLEGLLTNDWLWPHRVTARYGIISVGHPLKPPALSCKPRMPIPNAIFSPRDQIYSLMWCKSGHVAPKFRSFDERFGVHRVVCNH